MLDFWKMNKMGQGHSQKKKTKILFQAKTLHGQEVRSLLLLLWQIPLQGLPGEPSSSYPFQIMRTIPTFPSLVNTCLWDAYFTSSWQPQPLKRVKRPLQQSLCQNTQWEYQCAAWADFFLSLKWTPNCSLKEWIFWQHWPLKGKKSLYQNAQYCEVQHEQIFTFAWNRDMSELRIAACRN